MSGISTAMTPGFNTFAQVSVPNGSAAAILAATPSDPAKEGIVVQAASTNSASIWVGKADVTNTKGIELTAGQSVSIECSDPSTVFVYATSSGQKANGAWV